MQKTILIEFIPEFRNFISVSKSGRRKSPSGKKISAGTIRNYHYVLNVLMEFEVQCQSPLRITLIHRAGLRLLQREKTYWSRFFRNFSQFLYTKKNYTDSNVASIIKNIRVFFNYLHIEKGYTIGDYHKSFRVPIQIPAPVVLTPIQLQFLIGNKQFDESLSPALKRTKDIFVFGCTVGLRVSDLMKLRKKNIIQQGNHQFLHVFTQKTGSEVLIPIPEYLLEIIKRNSKNAGLYILPRLSNSNLNKQVKELAKSAGWDQLLPKYKSYKGTIKEIKKVTGNSWKFYEHITAHTMRRTAITTLLVLGVSETVVRKISGHAAGSKEFFKYVNIAQDYLNQEVQKAFSKLAEKDEK